MTTSSLRTKIVLCGVFALAVILIVSKFVFFVNYVIPQNGMYPGLPAGSRLFVSKYAYADASQVKRGDIAVFVSNQQGQPYNYIWRVIGLPGDVITTSEESLTINGQPVIQKFIRDEQGARIFSEQHGDVTFEIAYSRLPKQLPPNVSVTIPQGHFFMMGDNRFDAYDSRYLGFIPFSTFVGRKL